MRAVKVRAVLKESVCLYKNEPNYNLHSMSVVVRRCYSSERRIPSARSHLLPGGGESPSWTVAAEGGPNSTEIDGLSVTMLYDVVQNKDSLVYHCHIVLYSKNEPTSCKTKIIKEPSQISVSFCEYKKYPICCSLILSSCYNIKNFLFLTINSWWLTWCSCLVIPRMLEAGGGAGAKELISRDGDTVRWWGRVGRVSFPA